MKIKQNDKKKSLRRGSGVTQLPQKKNFYEFLAILLYHFLIKKILKMY
jgi:hypothetical protein